MEKQSLLGYSLPLPEAKGKEVKKEWDTDMSYYSGTNKDSLSAKPVEKNINHYPGRYNGPDHCGLMFNRWEDKPAPGSILSHLRGSFSGEHRPKYPKPQIAF